MFTYPSRQSVVYATHLSGIYNTLVAKGTEFAKKRAYIVDTGLLSHDITDIIRPSISENQRGIKRSIRNNGTRSVVYIMSFFCQHVLYIVVLYSSL